MENNKILLMVPNYSWFGKRAWNTLPFAIPILAAILKKYDFEIFAREISQHDYGVDSVQMGGLEYAEKIGS